MFKPQVFHYSHFNNQGQTFLLKGNFYFSNKTETSLVGTNTQLSMFVNAKAQRNRSCFFDLIASDILYILIIQSDDLFCQNDSHLDEL